MTKYKIKFSDKILDNVHGFIELTPLEISICELSIFKRLRYIKQLALANWVYPSAEHTRYNHSLGVMHIADRMAIKLNYNDEDRQLIRLAGLLHDIGHYPLSHTGESVYIKEKELNKIDLYYKAEKNKVIKTINRLKKNKAILDYTKKNKSKMHHEEIAKKIILKNKKIVKLLKKHNCDFINLNDICAIIVGDFNYKKELSDKIQLLHSELDADRIDYIIRDAAFSGTTYGSFGIDLLLENLVIDKYEGIKIVCLKSKGIPSADQFLIGRFFMYSQIMYNKHVSVLSSFAEIIMHYGIKNSIFYNSNEMFNILNKDEYLNFTDNFFWTLLNKLNNSCVNKEISYYTKQLLDYSHLTNVRSKEINIIATRKQAYEKLFNSELYKKCKNDTKIFPSIKICSITNHILEEDFKKLIKNEPNKEELMLKRLQNGLTVINSTGNIRLLIDDNKSLISSMYNSSLYLLRNYEID